MIPLFNKSNRLYFFATCYVLVLALLGAIGYFSVRQVEGLRSKAHPEGREDTTQSTAAAKTLYKLPRMELTLSSLEGATHHARISISLEIDKNNMERFIDFQPRVSDRIVSFMRQQDINAINNPNFMFVFRRDLLHEINDASGPVPVTNVIFREFIVR